MTDRAGFRLRPPPPFDLGVTVRGHGWISLPPHTWDPDRGTLRTVLTRRGRAMDVVVRAAGRSLAVELTATGRLDAAAVGRARRDLRHMLRLDEDLSAFWRLCARQPRLRWVARRGAGRMQRSPSVFEDLLKLLFTTNCSWSATRSMTRNLVAAIGPEAPSGRRGFPSAETCARGESFFREVVRAGYRARACAELAEAFAEGRLDDRDFLDPEVPTGELRRRLLALRGFGPYAAGQALRLLGHYDDLALDSWCRARLAELAGRRRPPSERTVLRRYAGFGRYRGLALWMDLTADWHGESPGRRGAKSGDGAGEPAGPLRQPPAGANP